MGDAFLNIPDLQIQIAILQPLVFRFPFAIGDLTLFISQTRRAIETMIGKNDSFFPLFIAVFDGFSYLEAWMRVRRHVENQK